MSGRRSSISSTTSVDYRVRSSFVINDYMWCLSSQNKSVYM